MLAMAAAAVPIALHLLSRREPRRVKFPAIRFLTQRFESNRSRLKIRRWWLLALRIAALIAVALALSHPVIHRDVSLVWLTIGLVGLLGIALLALASVAAARQGPCPTSFGLLAAAIAAFLAALGWGGYTIASGPSPSIDTTAPIALAIILDNGPTSDWSTADDDRIARMQELATWMITRVPSSSRIAVLDRSAVPAAFSLDVVGALSKVETLQPLQVTSPLASRLDAAIRLVRTSELGNRQVLVVSDLAESTWREDARGVDLTATLAAAPPVSVTVFDLGDFEGTNRSLSGPRIVDATPPRGVATPLVASIEVSSSDGATEELSVTAELQLYASDPGLPVVRNGQVERPQVRRVDRTNLRIRPGTAGEVLLTVPPLDVGTHHAIVRLVGDDPLSMDDERYFTLRVLPSSPLLIVGDAQEDADVFAVAITAPFEVGDPQAEFAVERVGYADLPAVMLDDFQGVILLDPPRSALRDRTLEAYVRAGGQLMICLGPTFEASDTADELTPTAVRVWRPVDPGTFLEILRPDDPLLTPFADQAEPARWSDYRVFQYWQLEVEAGDQVLAQFAGTGHPAIVRRGLGDGRVLVLATPVPALAAATRGWNEFFSASEPWPAFVLVRQIAEQLTGRAELGTDTAVGQPYLVRLDLFPRPAGDPQDASRSLPNEESQSAQGETRAAAETRVADAGESELSERVQLFPPGDRLPIPLTVDEEVPSRVLVREVSRAGTYWIRGTSAGGGFSANLPADATSLTRIDPRQLDLWFGPDQYVLATDREGVQLAEAQGTASVSLRSPLMLLALIVFLLEQILGNRFYRGGAVAAPAPRAVAA